MAHTDPRYEPIAVSWAGVEVPPITRDEAARAVRMIYRRFGGTQHGSANMTYRARFNGEVRRCWITTKKNAGPWKGWQRLVHDSSHRIFRKRHPGFRPHDGGHATLEREIAEHVLQKGWLAGTLSTKDVVISTEEKRAARLTSIEDRIRRWETKLKRSQNSLKKLYRMRRDLVKIVQK